MGAVRPELQALAPQAQQTAGVAGEFGRRGGGGSVENCSTLERLSAGRRRWSAAVATFQVPSPYPLLCMALLCPGVVLHRTQPCSDVLDCYNCLPGAYSLPHLDLCSYQLLIQPQEDSALLLRAWSGQPSRPRGSRWPLCGSLPRHCPLPLQSCQHPHVHAPVWKHCHFLDFDCSLLALVCGQDWRANQHPSPLMPTNGP